MKKKDKEIEVCEIQCIHEEDVKNVKEQMLEEATVNQLTEFFKVFGDATRIKILHALFQTEMCVCDIAAVLNMNQSAISHQLRVLKAARLVKYRREGKIIYYSLDDNHVMQVLEQGLAHIEHS
ncbi:ArsR/SmtB family transcription factor [Alkaliphilus transvaalensis]|uniref:ArsR/SmtB family transcription factor n=1 Tax=Alkaliphilus transvaalensis TaxID=114628 RepID=UPI000478C33F|nr:metalloregulator ArsR/SmtB family transcription factor [Alkaliphilus transvaalensis]